MIFAWYRVFELSDFDNFGTESGVWSIQIPDRGTIDGEVYNGRFVGLVYNGLYLPFGLNQTEPFIQTKHTTGEVFAIDVFNGGVYLGFEVQDDN